MAQNWNIEATDRPILECAIGAATLDKLRGFNTSLAEAYQSHGGQDPTSAQVLSAHDKGFSAIPPAKVAEAFAPGADVHSLWQQWNMSSHEQSLVARAIGATILAKLEGHGGDTLLHHYERLGGRQQEARDALQKVEGLFAKGDPAKLSR